MAAVKQPQEDKWVKTVCYVCQNTCSIKAHVVDGVVVKLEGKPESPNDFGFMCGKGNAGLIDLYNPNRLTKPLRRTNPEKGIGVDAGWEEITYEEALDIIARRKRSLDGSHRRILTGPERPLVVVAVLKSLENRSTF